MYCFFACFVRSIFFCFLFSPSVWAATFTVTQTVDDGSGTVAGTLSKAIVDVNATGGTEANEIIFDIPVTNPVIQLVGFSLPLITNFVVIDGVNKNGAGGTVTIDGSGLIGSITTGLFLSTGSENSVVKDITLQNFTSNVGVFFAIRVIVDGVTVERCVFTTLAASDECYGVADTTTANTSFITNLSVKKCAAATIESDVVAGVKAASMINCVENSFTDVRAPDTFLGIFIESETGNAPLGLCSRNTFQYIEAGEFIGINHLSTVASIAFRNELYCENLFDSIEATGNAVGIFVDTVPPVNGGTQQFSGNQIRGITGKKVAGINVVTPWGGLVCGNTIASLTARGGMKSDKAYGILLGTSIFDGGSNTVTDVNVYGNVIGDFSVLGRGTGCGVTIAGAASTANTILYNSIFSIAGPAISYPDNAPTDGTVQLLSAQCEEGKVTVSGILFPDTQFFTTNFLLQFFLSPSANPLEAKTIIGEAIVISAAGATPFSEMIFASSFPNLFITATATALPEGTVSNNNTSVVSNALISCSSITPGLCSFLMQPSPITPICPTGIVCPTGVIGITGIIGQ